jgi:hypothetical protein
MILKSINNKLFLIFLKEINAILYIFNFMKSFRVILLINNKSRNIDKQFQN